MTLEEMLLKKCDFRAELKDSSVLFCGALSESIRREIVVWSVPSFPKEHNFPLSLLTTFILSVLCKHFSSIIFCPSLNSSEITIL